MSTLPKTRTASAISATQSASFPVCAANACADGPNAAAVSILREARTTRALHQRLPERIRGAGTLYLWLRPGRIAGHATKCLRDAGRWHEFVDSCVRIPLRESEVQVCTGELASTLTEEEALETRALFMPGHSPPQL